MHQGTAKRSSLFLMELIVSILFFALASVVCVRLFVDARMQSRESADLNRAVLLCQNGAERFYSSGSIPQPEYFDKNFVLCAKENAVYTLSFSPQEEEAVLGCTVSLLKGEQELYSLPVEKYLQKSANTG